MTRLGLVNHAPTVDIDPPDVPVPLITLRIDALPRACPACRCLHYRAQPCSTRDAQPLDGTAAA